MSAWPTVQQWVEFGGIVSLELLLLFAIAKLISLRLRSAQRRRCLWQTVIVATLLVAGGEISGVRQMVRLPQSSPQTEEVIPPTRTVVVTIKDAELPMAAAPPLSFEPLSHPALAFTKPVSIWKKPTGWPAFLWTSVAALLLGRLLLGQILSLSFRVSARRPVNADLQRRANELAERLTIRRRVRLVNSHKTIVPFTFGIWRPVIVLPGRFEETFTPRQQDAALAHELAHVAGVDSAWRALSNFTCALLWWNPFAWLAQRELDHASELIADESSLLLADGPSALAECLVACAKKIHTPTAISWLGMDGGGFRSSLGQRVSRLLRMNPRAVEIVGVPWYWRITLPIICALTLWFAMQFVTRESAAPAQHPFRSSLMSSALAALAEPAKGDLSEADRIEAARLVQEGKLYYETDRLTEAETTLQAAFKLDPTSQAAAYYLDLVRAKQYASSTKVEEVWTEPVRGGHTNVRRQMIHDKLRSIRLPEFGPFENVRLTEVVRHLSDTARLLDPEHEGVKLFLSPNVVHPGVAQAVDLDLPVPPPTDMNAIKVRLGTQLKDQSLEQALNILIEVSDRKFKYSVEDYGIVISPKADESTSALHTRFFKVGPDSFSKRLASLVDTHSDGELINGVIKNPRLYDNPGKGESLNGGIQFLTEVISADKIIPTAKAYFKKAGVDLSDPGKAVFFNDRLGVLMVRATLQDLDTIDKALQMLNMSPPQLEIRVKVMEVPVENSRAALLPLGLTNATRSVEGSMDSSLTVANGFKTTNRPSPTITGILTDQQFRKLIADMEKMGGTDLLSALTVTTMSGRQAQIKVVDIRYIVTDLDYGTNGVAKNNAGDNRVTLGGETPGTPRPIAEPFEIGPVVDIVPYIEADGYTIQMTVLPTLREFLGYDEDPLHRRNDLPATGGPLAPTPRQPTPLPKFRLRQVASTARVWDGQTLVLGAGQSRTMEKNLDANGIITTNYLDKELFFFITPRLVDPAGNPLHSHEELERHNGVPEQQQPKPPVNEYE